MLKQIAVIAVGAAVGGAAAGMLSSNATVSGALAKVPSGWGPKIFVPTVTALGVIAVTSVARGL